MGMRKRLEQLIDSSLMEQQPDFIPLLMNTKKNLQNAQQFSFISDVNMYALLDDYLLYQDIFKDQRKYLHSPLVSIENDVAFSLFEDRYPFLATTVFIDMGGAYSFARLTFENVNLAPPSKSDNSNLQFTMDLLEVSGFVVTPNNSLKSFDFPTIQNIMPAYTKLFLSSLTHTASNYMRNSRDCN